MGYGFKGKVKETITELDRLRADKQRGRDITLRDYVSQNYKDANGNPLSIEHMFADLAIDPRRTAVHELMRDDDNKYLMSEFVREGVRRGLGIAQRERLEAIRKASMAPITADGGAQRWMSPEVYLDAQRLGLVQSTFYPDLIIREEPVAQPTVTIPSIDLSKATLKDSAEAATIEEGSVSYGSRDVKLRKKARGIGISYEAIQFNSLSLVQIFFEDAGRILGQTLNAMAVDTVVNGDQAGGTEAAAVIGVDNTTNGITWKDLTRVAVQGGLIGRTFSQAIGNATTALNYLNLDEVKNKQQGTPLLGTALRSPLTMPESLFVSSNVATNQLVLQDPSMSLVQLTAMPLMVETEKIISKQIEKSYASIMTGFAKLMRTASVIIDGSIAYSGNQFPAWMQPLSTE